MSRLQGLGLRLTKPSDSGRKKGPAAEADSVEAAPGAKPRCTRTWRVRKGFFWFTGPGFDDFGASSEVTEDTRCRVV